MNFILEKKMELTRRNLRGKGGKKKKKKRDFTSLFGGLLSKYFLNIKMAYLSIYFTKSFVFFCIFCIFWLLLWIHRERKKWIEDF